MSLRIDPYSLQLFITAAREGSLARAAAVENIATSALSRRIADLEHAFGVPLLTRSPHGVSLTDAGKVAFEGGKRLERGMEHLLQEVQSTQGKVAGTVRLFANASAIVGFLPERLKSFRAAYPHVQVILQERLSSEVLRACLDDIADIGIAIVHDLPNGVDAWRFADDPLIVVAPPEHPLSRQQSVRFTEALQYPLVCVQPGGALDRMIRNRASSIGAAMEVSVEVNSFDGVCRMVEAGLGIAIVPTSAATAYAGTDRFVRKTLSESWVGRELYVFTLRRTHRAEAVSALIEALKA